MLACSSLLEHHLCRLSADRCGPCQRIAPKFASLAAAHCGKAIFVKVDVDECPDTASNVGKVKAMPTFTCFKGDKALESCLGANEEGLEALVKAHCI